MKGPLSAEAQPQLLTLSSLPRARLPSVLLRAPLSFFLIVSLTLRDSWHPPHPRPSPSRPLRREGKSLPLQVLISQPQVELAC